MSLSLTLGILVADLTNLSSVTAAGAQTRSRGAVVANGTVVGHSIKATNVLVNGVVTNGVFRGSVAIADSLVSGVDPAKLTGVMPWDAPTSLSSGGVMPWVATDSISSGGVMPWVATDSLSSNGVMPWDATDSGASASSTLQLTGGVVEGENVQVIGGVITGRNLTVVGTLVSKTR